MSSSNSPWRIDETELFSSSVEEYLDLQRSLQRDPGDAPAQPLLVRILLSSWFYLAAAGSFGGIVAWLVLEPFFTDEIRQGAGLDVAALLLFPTVAGGIGLFLGAAEGIMCRQTRRAILCGAVGLGIGFGGGLVALLPAGLVFAVMSRIAMNVGDEPAPGAMPTGFALLILMMGRSAAWAIAAIPAGLGQGIALREKKVIVNGLVGAVLGGLVGGLLFDPISLVFVTPDGEAAASRGVGFAVIGLMVGLFVGLVESWTKTAWLLMRKGPLAGKQFVLYRETTTVGSSPKADIYLFKDDAIDPRHALIHNRGGRFEIEDCQTADGTYVNGYPIQKYVLQAGDQVVLGKTVLEFSVKESS